MKIKIVRSDLPNTHLPKINKMRARETLPKICEIYLKPLKNPFTLVAMRGEALQLNKALGPKMMWCDLEEKQNSIKMVVAINEEHLMCLKCPSLSQSEDIFLQNKWYILSNTQEKRKWTISSIKIGTICTF